jgi:hypothetical protein
MHYELFSIISAGFGFLLLIMIIFLVKRSSSLNTKLAAMASIIIKMQNTLKSKEVASAIAQNAEIVYQDLLQQLIPITASIGIKQRETPEHPLWRWAGGLMDEYSKNPYVLEQIRQTIKLDSTIARATDTYIDHASNFLEHIVKRDSDGLLTTAFSDGLLGQTITLLSQARQMATNN